MKYLSLINWLASLDKSFFKIPIEKQQKYLDNLPEPKDLYERSFFQYKCQCFFSPLWKKIGLNIIASIAYPFVLLYFLMKCYPKNIGEYEMIISKDNGLHENLVPSELTGKLVQTDDGFVISFIDLEFLFNVIKRYPFSAYFNLKILFKIAQYHYMIRQYCPKSIVVHSEFSFCSSLLTLYCNQHNIKHIDIMHGEKLYLIKDSFFQYDKCYVWDQYYINLFKSLRTDISQFVISIPKSLVFDPQKYFNFNYYADYKYYLTKNTKSELQQIIGILKRIQNNGYSIKVRPHPLCTDLNILKSLIDEEYIESSEIPIESSISNVKNVISCYSTVLQQAYYTGKNIIIDDVVYKYQYDKLVNLKYIMVNKPHIKLSDVIKNS